MSMLGTSLLFFLLWLPQDKPAPKFPLGKETTYVTGPLDKEGYIDYEAALNDRMGKGISLEKNANVLLWEAFGPGPEGGRGMPTEYFRRLGIAEPPKEGDYLIGWTAFLKDHLKLSEEEIEVNHHRVPGSLQGPWTAKDFPHVAAWLKANEKPLAVVVEATKRPEYFNPLVSRRTGKEPSSLMAATLPTMQKCREAAQAFVFRSKLRIGEGKFDEAWQDLLACHRLGRLVAQGGTIIESLVGIAIDSIACQADLPYLERAPLTSQQIQDRLKELQGLLPFPPVADKVELADRFAFLENVQFVRRGGVGIIEMLAGGQADKPDRLELQALEQLDWDTALRSGNRWYDRIVTAMRLPDRVAREKELGKIEAELQELKQAVLARGERGQLVPGKPVDKSLATGYSDMLICLLTPSTHKVQTAHDRIAQMHRNLHLAFALAAYHRDQGRYPAKLDDLAPRYLASIPNDIFSGKSLIYRPEGKGYLLYSVGINGRDDDGRTQGDDPLGGDDIRIRMPLPEVKKEK